MQLEKRVAIFLTLILIHHFTSKKHFSHESSHWSKTNPDHPSRNYVTRLKVLLDSFGGVI